MCREHKADNVCGRCLRPESPSDDALEPVISRSEDDESFPYVDSTCTACRQDAVNERARTDAILKEALVKLHQERGSIDWEVRQAIENFVDFGEGSVHRIVMTGWEKDWLRKHTKIREYLDQAVASIKYQNREEGYESEDEASDEEDVLCLQEEAGVKDIAVNDYCRLRILDGSWTLPYDSFMGSMGKSKVSVITSQVPVAYMRSAEKDGTTHPSSRTLDSPPPPTHELASYVSRTFHNEMRNVIMPALQNLVRLIVIESNKTGVDPSLKATKMTIEDIIRSLHLEGVWWNGFDWHAQWDEREREKEAQARAARANSVRQPRIRIREDEAEDSNSDRTSPSSVTTGSHETSPVLSAATLQTTPSPPPPLQILDERRKRGSDGEIKEAPSVIRAVPAVPLTSEGMPHYTKEMLQAVSLISLHHST
jgi:hypothetical protein